MSAGPIRAEREAYRVPRVSTPDVDRVCKTWRDGRGYCGRRSAPKVVKWADVHCADCIAAARADGLKV